MRWESDVVCMTLSLALDGLHERVTDCSNRDDVLLGVWSCYVTCRSAGRFAGMRTREQHWLQLSIRDSFWNVNFYYYPFNCWTKEE